LLYIIYTLIFKKELFEVRNSPLNRNATILGKVLYCVKFGCVVMGLGAFFFAGGVASESLLVLVEAFYDRKFLPFMVFFYTKITELRMENLNNLFSLNTF
jgi:hypothetical protein